GGVMVGGHPKECRPGPLHIGQRVARLVDMVARLAGGANDGEPLAVLPRRDGSPGHRPEGHGSSAGTHVVELLLMDMSTKDVTRVSGSDALFRFRWTGDVGPLLGRRGAGMHEEDIVIPDGERQGGEERALLFAKLSPSPGYGGLCVVVQVVVGSADRSRIVVAPQLHRAVRG